MSAEETSQSGRVWEFSQTNPLTPYLIAITVGKLVRRDVSNKGRVPIVLWAERDIMESDGDIISGKVGAMWCLDPLHPIFASCM